jgi:endogenous inhibitor of DNA gyrase (YacG/DUF329 family)
MSNVKTVRCPTCGTPVEWSAESRFRPFCSARCKDVDLGAWASESYRIPVKNDDPDGDRTDESPDRGH